VIIKIGTTTVLGGALDGMGLAQVPAPLAADAVKAGRLMEVLAPFAPTVPGIFLYYPGRRQILPKLRAFIDHIKSGAAGPPSRDKLGRKG
jgi:DNA-binding transcriptional LysR family regulator